MSLSSVFDDVIVFGGVGTIIYFLLKKPTPELVTAPPAGSVDTRPTSFQTRCEEEKPTPYTNLNFYNQCREILKSTSEIWKPLIDPSSILLVSDPIKYNTYSATYRAFYLPTGDLKSNTCGDLDLSAKAVTSLLQSEYKLAGAGSSNKATIATLEQVKKDIDTKFEKFNCRDKIEAERTKTSIDLETKYAIKAEESIAKKGFAEQKTYIILGSLVLLTGLYVVVKK